MNRDGFVKDAMREVMNLNPIIERERADTLQQVECCLAFIQRVHADAADWKMVATAAGCGGPDEMTAEEHRGLSLLASCVRAAVQFEAYGREDLEALRGAK